MWCHLLAFYESTTTTVSAKNILYCFPEEKKSLTSWMAWRWVSKLTANFHFNIFIWPEIFRRGTQNCGSPFPLSQVLQPWPIYHATTSNNVCCALAIPLRLVIASRSSSVKGQQKVMGYKETVVETRSENDTRVTGNIMWNRAGVESGASWAARVHLEAL